MSEELVDDFELGDHAKSMDQTALLQDVVLWLGFVLTLKSSYSFTILTKSVIIMKTSLDLIQVWCNNLYSLQYLRPLLLFEQNMFGWNNLCSLKYGINYFLSRLYAIPEVLLLVLAIFLMTTRVLITAFNIQHLEEKP